MHEKRRERGRTYRVGLILGFCLLIAVNGLFPVSCVYAEEEQTKIAYGENTPGQLYARSAVLMDADSGRILFAKNAETERPMARTTKIMTCILALERADPDESVSVSANAAAQPRVRLGTVEGQKFKLKDLLYSLMLESHNDTAVMLAEHLAGSVEQFADEGRTDSNTLSVFHFYRTGICFCLNNLYADFYSITYVIFKPFAAVVSETMVVTYHQAFHLKTFF